MESPHFNLVIRLKTAAGECLLKGLFSQSHSSFLTVWFRSFVKELKEELLLLLVQTGWDFFLQVRVFS